MVVFMHGFFIVSIPAFHVRMKIAASVRRPRQFKFENHSAVCELSFAVLIRLKTINLSWSFERYNNSSIDQSFTHNTMPSSLSTEQSWKVDFSSIFAQFIFSSVSLIKCRIQRCHLRSVNYTKWFLIIVPFWHLSSKVGYFLIILSSTRFTKLDHPDTLRNRSILLLYTGIPLCITLRILSPTTTWTNYLYSANLLSHTSSSSTMQDSLPTFVLCYPSFYLFSFRRINSDAGALFRYRDKHDLFHRFAISTILFLHTQRILYPLCAELRQFTGITTDSLIRASTWLQYKYCQPLSG